MTVSRSKSHRKSGTVLLIDDEAQWLELISEALADESYSIITASSAEAALKKLEKNRPDLILSDVRMPILNGFDLFEKVRSNPKFRGIPYVFMSSLDDYDAKKTARDLGADDYFEKPFEAEGVKTIVLNLLLRFKASEATRKPGTTNSPTTKHSS
jgi:DNA-binding response OmpR family regulator